MACLRHSRYLDGLLFATICLFILLCWLEVAAADQQQPPLPATATIDSNSCRLQDYEEGAVCSEKQQEGYYDDSESLEAAREAAAAAATRRLHEQLRTQQQMLSVLGSIAAGTFTADAAVSLLQDAAALRESLMHGAAARRWEALKARSAKRSSTSTSEAADTQQDAASRGILIVAGGRHQFLNAYILLQLLRHPTINCSLPAELIYYGPSEYDVETAELMTAHAAKTNTQLAIMDGSEAAAEMDLEPHLPTVHLTGFKTKVHALAFVTTFDQVLLLDSDNTPLADPTYLFESAEFTTFGNLLWLDFWTNQWMQPGLYSLLGLDVPWEVNPEFRASEAGQLLLDRVQHYDVLEWLWLLNTHSSSGVPGVREAGVVGRSIWGDKDTYLIAFQLAGKEQYVTEVPHYPLQALSRPVEAGMFVHAGMMQRGLHGELMFLHRTAAGKLWPHCAWNDHKGCKVWGATTPVDQQQLVPSVRDVTAMQFEPDKVDMAWQEQHCGPGHFDFAGESGDEDSQQQHWHATMLACDLDKSTGLLPIPVIALQHLPVQVQQMLEATYTTFLDTMQPTAHGGHTAAEQHYEDGSDPYY